jgi:hypothetical protein
MIKSSILFKKHENPDCDQLLHVINYLQSVGYDAVPSMIIEHNFPKYITVLPTAIIGANSYFGIESIVNYFEKTLGLDNLMDKSNKYKKINMPV